MTGFVGLGTILFALILARLLQGPVILIAALVALVCPIVQPFLFASVRVSSLLFAGIAVSLAVKNVRYCVCLDALEERIEWICQAPSRMVSRS